MIWYNCRKPSKVFTPDREKKNVAASTIQHTWRRRRAVAKQEKYQRENEEAIIGIQSALKGHLARRRTLSLQNAPPTPPAVCSNDGEEGVGGRGMEEADDSDEAIEVIQSAVRGYFTRQMVLQDLQQSRYPIPVYTQPRSHSQLKPTMTDLRLRQVKM